jgi:hypothetical protein
MHRAEKLTVKKVPEFYGMPKFITMFIKAPTLLYSTLRYVEGLST